MVLETTAANTRLRRVHMRSIANVTCFYRGVGYRLLRVTVRFSLMVVLICCLAIGWSHIQPPVNAASAIGLGWCRDIPCFKNLVPGETRWTEQLAEFDEQHPSQNNPYHLSLSASTDHHVLGTLVLPLSASMNVSAGDIVELYGAPCLVDITFYWNWASVILYFPHLEALLNIDESGLRPELLIHKVILIEPSIYTPRSQTNLCDSSPLPSSVTQAARIQRHWHGFTTPQSYLAYAP